MRGGVESPGGPWALVLGGRWLGLGLCSSVLRVVFLAARFQDARSPWRSVAGRAQQGGKVDGPR